MNRLYIVFGTHITRHRKIIDAILAAATSVATCESVSILDVPTPSVVVIVVAAAISNPSSMVLFVKSFFYLCWFFFFVSFFSLY